jgi:hypothetical protein
VKVVKSIAVMRILKDEIITFPPLASLIELRFPPLSRQKVDGLKQFFSIPEPEVGRGHPLAVGLRPEEHGQGGWVRAA